MKAWENWTLVGIAICFLLTLFPPFVGGKSGSEEKFIGFHLLFGTPKYRSPNEQVSRSYSTVNGEKKLVSERHYYPEREYTHCQIDPVRYMFLVLLMTFPLAFAWIIIRRREAYITAHPGEAPE